MSLTVAQLHADLLAKPFVKRIGTPIKDGSPNEWGDQKYRIGIQKRAQDLVNYEFVHYVVLHEGTPPEVACYLKTNNIAFENAAEHFDEGGLVVQPPVVVVDP